MSEKNFSRKCVHLCVCSYILACLCVAFGQLSPLTCSDPSGPSCSAIIYVPNSALTTGSSKVAVANLFNASSPDNVLQNFENGNLVLVNCACYSLPDIVAYFAVTSYTVTEADSGSGLGQISRERFDSLAWSESGVIPVVGKSLEIYVGCGCQSSQMFQSVVSYAVQTGDTLGDVATRFQSNMTEIGNFNNIPNISNIETGRVLFLPSRLSPSSLYNLPSPPLSATPGTKGTEGKKVSVSVVVAIGISVAVVLAITVIIIHLIRTRKRRSDDFEKQMAGKGGPAKVDFEVNTQNRSKGSSSSFSGFLGSWNNLLKRPGSLNNNVKRAIALPEEAKDVFEAEKPIVFTYDEVAEASLNFEESRKLGEGAFGAVYRGYLRNQDVAIKKMKASKSREFVAELKVLCKVHHSNLVELIGYAVGEEELYLVYEFAEHGALSDRLHDPIKKGYQPLSWTERVQIALDAARGLEYIHDHTRTHYIHRDVKTSNILLDGLFRAKVGDFGLAKLLEHAGGEGGNVTTKVVGTVGYLAPEYIRDGQVTSKSDVYAFGVVLMELITGLEALSKSKGTGERKGPDQRSLVSLLYSLSYQGEINFEMLYGYVDSNLQNNYAEEGILKMANLARACVDEDSMARPDMREIVFKLSQLLLASIEWEASLAGSSQIFSGIVGR